MSNYIFEENEKLGITNVYQKEKNILLGFIHENSKRFIYIFSPTIKVISNKIKSFKLQKDIDSYQKELDSQSKFFANKQRKKDLIFDIKNNQSKLESLESINFLNVEDLSEELRAKGIEFISFNQGYALLPEQYNFGNTEELINQNNLNHLWDMNYFKLYNLLSVKDKNDYLGTTPILTRSFMQNIISKEQKGIIEIIDIKLSYNLFMDNEDEKIKAIEKGLKLIMHDKDVFYATIEMYSSMFVNFTSLIGLYDGVPFMIQDGIFFTSNVDEESFKKYSQFMFDISIYSK